MDFETAANREALFEVRSPDGHVYQVFPDGRISGFPAGSVVINWFPHHVEKSGHEKSRLKRLRRA